MVAGVKPYLSAGIALVGASIIAVSPVGPPPVELAAASPAVQLAAIPSPLQLYPRVAGTALDNGGALLSHYFADPFPITAATLRNQASAVEDAFTALAFGRFDEFYAAVADVFLQPFTSAAAAWNYFDLAIHQPLVAEGLITILWSPVLSGIAAAGTALRDVVEAVFTVDLVGLVNAVLNIPARVIDGVLNGGYGSPLGGFFDNIGGLLSAPDEDSEVMPGPIAIAIAFDQTMGQEIPPRTSIFPVAPPPELDAAALTADAPSEAVATKQESGASEELDAPDLSDGAALSDEAALEEDGGAVTGKLDELTPDDDESANFGTDEVSASDDVPATEVDSRDDDTPSTSAAPDSEDSAADAQ